MDRGDVMLGHDFQEMPGRSTEIGDNPHETIMLLRCKWCNKTPKKAREDGCPIHELEEIGTIVLSQFNPAGVEYFKGRTCVTCDKPIMDHWLMRGSQDYWCTERDMQVCEGINDCVYEVEGIAVPQERTEPEAPRDVTVRYTDGCQPQ